jgi:hypothetical protein
MNAISPLRLAEGIHRNVPEAAYHDDPGVEPSASSGILRTIIGSTAKHAWQKHPRLNSAYEPSVGTEAMNRGSILHALTLETPPPFRVLDVADYRSGAAKALRDETIAAGLIPVKSADINELYDIAASIRAGLKAMPEVWAAMQDAVASQMTEVSLLWREQGVLCRCRYDTLPAARFGATYDPKFTGLSAEPDAFGKKVTNDYAFQADLYPRAVKALRGDSPLFVFVAIETNAPYGITLHALDPEAADLARQKVDAALAVWAQCLRSGVWPSYSSLIHYHGAKPWEINAWEEKQEHANQAREIARRPKQSAIDSYNQMMTEMGAQA